jgi:hypothetical protein
MILELQLAHVLSTRSLFGEQYQTDSRTPAEDMKNGLLNLDDMYHCNPREWVASPRIWPSDSTDQYLLYYSTKKFRITRERRELKPVNLCVCNLKCFPYRITTRAEVIGLTGWRWDFSGTIAELTNLQGFSYQLHRSSRGFVSFACGWHFRLGPFFRQKDFVAAMVMLKPWQVLLLTW